MVKPKKKYPKVNKIRKDLLSQLEAKGLTGEYYKNLVEDYIFLFKQKEDAQEDILFRGNIVDYTNSKGFESQKKNESCDIILKNNQQMIKILEYLGIKPSENISDKDDVDDIDL